MSQGCLVGYVGKKKIIWYFNLIFSSLFKTLKAIDFFFYCNLCLDSHNIHRASSGWKSKGRCWRFHLQEEAGWHRHIPHTKAQLHNVGHSAANKPQEAGRIPRTRRSPKTAKGMLRSLLFWKMKGVWLESIQLKPRPLGGSGRSFTSSRLAWATDWNCL